MQNIKSRWHTFEANYRWSDWVQYIDGWIPKFALFVPILGYLILFNDDISKLLEFSNMMNKEVSDTGLDSNYRLRLIYFGLILLGLSNFLYKLKKPYQFKFGNNFIDYSKTCLEIFTLSDYVKIHGTIRHEGHYTTSGKYYDSEWEGFIDAAKNTDEGKDSVKRDGNWELAKSQYGSLLRDMLYDNFFRNDVKKRFWLSVSIFLSTLGYVFLIIPSGDIFIKVIRATIGF